MNKVTVSDEEIKEFIRRAQHAHFRGGHLIFEGRHIITRDLFAPGGEITERVRDLILNIRSGYW
jgi:hypothetical protein